MIPLAPLWPRSQIRSSFDHYESSVFTDHHNNIPLQYTNRNEILSVIRIYILFLLFIFGLLFIKWENE